jgi:tripartite-type tricarboxylate transporter receptor subunit TctC
MTKRGFDVTWMDSVKFAAFLKEDDAEIGKILKELGLAK